MYPYLDARFEDPKAQAVIERFQQDLEQIEGEIEQRNTNRPLPYTYLKPSQIINSINT